MALSQKYLRVSLKNRILHSQNVQKHATNPKIYGYCHNG